jgi:uncharacterized C2H2 Zn-finger protein
MRRNPDFQCPYCDAHFPSRKQLKSHAFKEHEMFVRAGRAPSVVTSSGPQWRCGTCGEGFYTKKELEAHYADHAGRSQRSYGAQEYLQEVARRQEADPDYQQIRALQRKTHELYDQLDRDREQRAAEPFRMDKGSWIFLGILAAGAIQLAWSSRGAKK